MNYQKYKDKAETKINQYGSPCKIIRKGDNEVYDEETDTYKGDDIEIKGVALMRNYDLRDIDGTVIQMNDVEFLASFSEMPQTGDTIIFGSKSYTVVRAKPLNPNGLLDIFYTIQAR